MKRYEGKVKWFNNERGYGFVQIDDDAEAKDYFVHFSHIVMDGFKTLIEGQKVTFTLAQTDRGVQAHEVQPVD
jgi:CspA family cold shock protein